MTIVRPLRAALAAFAIAASLGGMALAQEAPSRTEQSRTEQSVLRLLPGDAVTEHAIDTVQGRIAYTATAGTLPLYDQSGAQAASIFYTAYVAKAGSKESGSKAGERNRPVTFVFNGGPGAASAFLHLGLVGPQVAEFGVDGRDPAATRLHDNPHTWLAFTDLVMVDPVGAGYSRAVKSDGAKAFWSVQRDAEAMAKVITNWIAKNDRSGSAIYLLGESYGGFRAAKVARLLQRTHGMATSGVIMVSPLLEGAFTFGGTRFALGAAMQLPSLAAAELERTGKFSMEAMKAAEQFTLNEYLPKLAGPPLRGEEAQAFYRRVADISGMPLDVVTQTRGFIRDTYIRSLRRADGKVVSRYDATFAAPDPYPGDPDGRGPDPMLDGVARAYGGAFAAYASDTLKFKTPMSYVLLSNEANGNWEWGERGGRANASVDGDLRALLTLQPNFRLLIAHGYTDMITPYAVSRYVLDHLPDIENPGRGTLSVFRGGHMFYLDERSRREFSTTAAALYAAEP